MQTTLQCEWNAAPNESDRPPSLVKAEGLIGENLNQNPNDPTWLQARARADLMDGNYEAAIESLQHALEVELDSPGLLTDLGSAYFLRGMSIGQLISATLSNLLTKR